MLTYNAPLAKFSSWKIGGAAKCLYQPKNLAELQTFLKILPSEEPVRYLGLGSNTLIRDGGIAETVVILLGVVTELEIVAPNEVKVGAGVSCAQFARFCARSGLVGMEFLAGVPGTMGGALAMNAGAHGGETWDFVKKVTMLNRQGELVERMPQEFGIHYRQIDKPAEEAFMAGYFRLSTGDAQASLEKIRRYLAHRSDTQPIDLPNGGSVFRNPPGNFAGKLIEASGLKGYRIGGAWVSPKHANFIVVDAATACAADVENLVEFIENTVREKHGVDLVREIHILGERT